tara:strand:+ start:452 stop:1105 length:654 start_codon:yes stop_codon:yes gene_type:complete
MAFTAKQYQNFIKVIMVAAVAKEFRNASIIKRIIANAKAEDHIATGSLIRPDATGSITPSSDDKWISEASKGISVVVGGVEYGIPSDVTIKIEIGYGLDFRYNFLNGTESLTEKGPSKEAIKQWVKIKADRGHTWELKGKAVSANDESKLNAVAFLIRRSMKSKGIRQTKFAEPFKDKSTGVDATLRKGFLKGIDRVTERFEVETYNSVVDALETIF